VTCELLPPKKVRSIAHNIAILNGPAKTVGVTTYVFWFGACLRNEAPFNSGENSAASAAKVGVFFTSR